MGGGGGGGDGSSGGGSSGGWRWGYCRSTMGVFYIGGRKMAVLITDY